MKKPNLAVLIGVGKPKKEAESEDDAPSSGEMSGHKAELAKEILAAVKADDADKLAEALCALIEVHDAHEDEETPEEESAEHSETDEDEEGE